MELMMAMGLFAIAAVSLAEALSTISLSVTESIDEAEIREKLRATMLEVTRDPSIQPDQRETNPDEAGVYFRILIERMEQQTRNGETLANLFDVQVSALRRSPNGREEILDTAQTWVYPQIF